MIDPRVLAAQMREHMASRLEGGKVDVHGAVLTALTEAIADAIVRTVNMTHVRRP